MTLSPIQLTDQPSLEAIINEERGEINSLADENISATAGINPAKIAFTYDLDTHAARHGTGGDDPLPSGAISTTMLVDAAVTTSKLGVKSVTATNLADGALFDNFDSDTTGTAAHGDVISPPEGYDISKCLIFIEGYDFQKTTVDQVRLPINCYVVRGASSFSVTCTCVAYSPDAGQNLTVNGNIRYRLMAFK